MEFTGERLVPGKVKGDLWAEHFSRYVFAEPLVGGRRVLDLGTGTGYGAQYLARAARRTVAIDISAEAIRYGFEQYPAPALSYLVADATTLPFATASFDVVVAFEVIEHVARQAELLAEVRRVLAPGGTFVVSTPNRLYYTEERNEHNAFHVREFDLEEFVAFLKTLFPKVTLHLQNHVPAVTISLPGDPSGDLGRLRAADGVSPGDALRTAHYGVAVCGAEDLQVNAVVFFPEGTGNVLREREQHLRSLERELAHATSAGREEARTLEHELEAARGDLGKLRGDFGKLRGDFEKLSGEFEGRTAWALALDGDLRRAQQDYQRLAGEHEELQRRAEELQRGAEELQRGTDELRSRLALATRPQPLRRLLRRALPYAAAMAALPLGAAVAGAAVAAGTLGKLIPAPERLPNLKPLDPHLATLLVLNYQGKELLAKNVPFLQAAIARSRRPHQLLVVDNGSDDGSADLLRERFPDVDCVSFPENYFFSGGNDRGLTHVRHDIVVLLNNDMRVEPDFLDPLLRPFEADASVFAVASQILMAPGKRQEETGLTRGRFVGGRIEFRHDPVPAEMLGRPIPILWGGGGACAFDRRKFMELGGLDLLYDPFYCEDTDLSIRAWRRGWKVLFAPESKVWHDHRTTSRRIFGESFVNETVRRNMLLLQWANLREPDLMMEHALELPRLVARDVRQHGWSGVRSLGRAVVRAPRAFARRLRDTGDGPALRTILEATDAGVDPAARRRPRAAREPLRVTMVAPYHLYPVQHGGAVRMYNVVRELARRGHEVSVVGFVESEEQREAGRHLREFCREVDLLVRVPAPNRWRGLVPADVAEFDLPDFRSALVAHLERCDPDILQVEYTHMAPYGRLAGGRVACLTEHDVSFVSRYRHTLAEGDRRARWSRYRNYLETFHFELNALRAFDVVFAVTSRDAQLLRTYLDGAIHVSDRVPIGANVHAMGSAQRNPDPRRLVFVGNFAHSPNVDAVTFFAREIMPDLLRQEPDLRIVIAGPNPPPAIQRLGSDPRVEVTGFVPDLAPIYATACAFISPIRIAAGVRVKLLEAFAARVPVVTTSAGAEGIDLAHEREALIADTPAEFVNQTLRLVRDPALGERLASSARRLVEERYSWTSIVDALEDEYRAAMRRKEARGGIV